MRFNTTTSKCGNRQRSRRIYVERNGANRLTGTPGEAIINVVALTHYLPIEDPYAFFHLPLPKSVASGRDLLVAAKAVSVNPVDTRVRNSKDQLEDPRRILGWDASGVVEALGPDFNRCKVGDEA